MPGYGLTSKGINYDIMRERGPHGHASQPQLSTHNKGGRVGHNKGGRIGRQIGGRANLLEEVGRIDAEKMNPNRRAEKSRVIGELNKGYNKGGRVGADSGKYISKKTKWITKKEKPKAWITKKDKSTQGKDVPTMASKGGRIGAKAGGDGKWIQKVNASIKRRGTKGKCTPITKKGCTGRAKALAKTFKKMAKKRKAA